MSEHNHTGLDEAASVASNTMQAVRTGKAISAAAKGAAAGGPYGAAIGAALSARKHIGKIAVAALVFVSLLLRYDISLRTLEAWAVACLLLACAFADLEGYIIPDRFIAVGVVLFIVTLFFVPDPGKRALDGLIGGVAVGGGVLLLALGAVTMVLGAAILGPRHRAGRLVRRPVRPEPYRLVPVIAVSPHLQESEVFCFEEDRWH